MGGWGSYKKVYNHKRPPLIMFEEFLYRIGPSNIFLILIFLISFIALHYSLIRVFNKQPASGSILAILFAIGITYSIWWYGFDIQSFFYGFGFDMNTLYLIAPIFLIIIMIIIGFLFGPSTLFLIFGLLLMILSYWAYEKVIVFAIGGVLFIIGLIMLSKKMRKKQLQRV